MNQNRLFHHQHQSESKYDAIYRNIDKTVLGNKIYFKLEVYNIKTIHTYNSQIYRGRFEMIENMTVETMRKYIYYSIMYDSSDIIIKKHMSLRSTCNDFLYLINFYIHPDVRE